MLNSFQLEGKMSAPLNTCIDGNGHVTSVARVCYKCKKDLNNK